MLVHDFEEYARALEGRKRACGYSGADYVPKNSGVTRREEKRALLRALDEAVKASGQKPKFTGNY